MIDLNDHHYFVQAVDHGGFTAAGRALNIPKSTISRRVIELEARLGVKLIERTSRSFATTDVGRAFYKHAKAMLIEAEAAENLVLRRLAEPSGTIRLTCSVSMAASFRTLLLGFAQRYPKVTLVQHTTNTYVDLIEEGFDIGLRGHSAPLPDSTLIARRLARTNWQAFAAPEYLIDAGEPSSPEDLSDHNTLDLGTSPEGRRWQLQRGDEVRTVDIAPRLQSSDMETLKAAAIAGHGVVSLPAYMAKDEVRDGQLQTVLPQWTTQQAQVTLLTPPNRSQLPSVRALIDYLVEGFPAVANAEL